MSGLDLPDPNANDHKDDGFDGQPVRDAISLLLSKGSGVDLRDLFAQLMVKESAGAAAGLSGLSGASSALPVGAGVSAEADLEDIYTPAPKPATSAKSSDRLARGIMERILLDHRSCTEYVRFTTFKRSRNQHEARRIAQVLDQARRVASLDEIFMEMLCRNLAGIIAVDLYNDPSLLEQIELAPPQELISRDHLRLFVKDAKRLTDLKKSVTSGERNKRAGGAK